MRLWGGWGKQSPHLAIFYGKQAVNALQAIRSEIRGLDKNLRQSFLKSKEDTYLTLADLLLSEGRLPEAEQVLRFLKEEELFEFVRRDRNAVDVLARVALTKTESEWAARYQEIADRITALGAEHGTFKQKKRTTGEEARFQILEGQLCDNRQAFQAFLAKLAQALGESQTAGEQVATVKTAQTLQPTLRTLGDGTVGLYTVTSKERLWIMLVTPDAYKAYETPISAADLSRKVSDFRQAVQDRNVDPRPLGQELYMLLLGPVANDLRTVGARTLMWSLDGVPRYLPIAALYGGQQYVAERWRTVVFTLEGRDVLKDAPSGAWRAAGLGVSKPHPGFDAHSYYWAPFILIGNGQ